MRTLLLPMAGLCAGLTLIGCQDSTTGGDDTEESGQDDWGENDGGDGGDGGGGGSDAWAAIDIEPAALGIEIFAGWHGEDRVFTPYFYEGYESVYNPRVELTVTDVEYFSLDGDDPSREEHYCTFYADFDYVVVEESMNGYAFNYDAGSGRGTGVYPLEFFADGGVTIWGNELALDDDGELIEGDDGEYIDKPVCAGLKANGYPEMIDGMHVGFGLGPVSAYLQSEYWDNFADDLAPFRDAVMGLFIAVNHPNAEADDGYDFVPYDWSSAVFWDGQIETLTVTPETGEPYYVDGVMAYVDPTELTLTQGLAGETGYLSSSTYWYEDYPNLDFDLLKEGVPLITE